MNPKALFQMGEAADSTMLVARLITWNLLYSPWSMAVLHRRYSSGELIGCMDGLIPRLDPTDPMSPQWEC